MSNNKLQIISDILNNYEIIITNDVLNKFENFEKFIFEFNKNTNLMSANDINLIYEKHFADSLAFCKFISQKLPLKIIDIGSGGGFPVIPIAIILNNATITSVEATGKKSDFLNTAAKKIGLKNFISINDRAETLARKMSFREKFDFVTARAVGNLAMISELCLPYIKIGGKFLAYKSIKVNDEIAQAENAINILGGRIIDIFEYDLKLKENFKRNLVVIEKVLKTPDDYPRSFSAIKNKTL